MRDNELLPKGPSPRPAETEDIPYRFLPAAAWHSSYRGPLEVPLLPGPGGWRPVQH